MHERKLEERYKPIQPLEEFHCHRMAYVLRGGNLHCLRCAEERSIYPEFKENAVKTVRHFISIIPVHRPRLCISCRRQVLLVRSALSCEVCREYYYANIDYMQYEDGVADVTYQHFVSEDSIDR